MSKKQDFIKYVEDLMDFTKKMDAPIMNENAELYWKAFCGEDNTEKPLFTDNGKLVLKYLQDNQQETNWKARDIAEGLFLNSRTVSGAMRKLVNDGYVEKMGQDPTLYSITEKGKNIKIDD